MPRIKSARVSFLSFVPRGANKLAGLYKSDDGLEIHPLVKTDRLADEGILTAIAYAPNLKDAHGHFADEAAVKEMAYTFMQEGAKLDIRHNRRELKKEQAYVAESFIIQKGDPRFTDFKDSDGKVVDPTGAWGTIIKIEHPDIRKAYRDGDWEGVSLFSYPGDFEIEQDKLDKTLEDIQREEESSDALKPMDAKEFAQLLKVSNDELLKGLTEALKPKEEKKEDPKDKKDATLEKEKAPVFTGSYSDVAALQKFSQELGLYNLRQKYDLSNPEQLQKYIEELGKLEKTEETDEEQKAKDPEIQKLEDELAQLQKSLAKARKQSNVPITEKSNGSNLSISKEDEDAWKAGEEIGNLANSFRGYK